MFNYLYLIHQNKKSDLPEDWTQRATAYVNERLCETLSVLSSQRGRSSNPTVSLSTLMNKSALRRKKMRSDHHELFLMVHCYSAKLIIYLHFLYRCPLDLSTHKENIKTSKYWFTIYSFHVARFEMGYQQIIYFLWKCYIRVNFLYNLYSYFHRRFDANSFESFFSWFVLFKKNLYIKIIIIKMKWMSFLH